MSVVDLNARRAPVCFTVDLVRHWDDRLELFVRDVSDDQRSRDSVADCLERAAAMLRNPTNTTSHD